MKLSIFATMLLLVFSGFCLFPVSLYSHQSLSSPSKSASSRLRIASWNILNLGRTTPVRGRAAVLGQFDIVALQEIESIQGFSRLRKAVEKSTGEEWGAVLSGKTGRGGAAEYYGFIWRRSLVSIIAGCRGTYPEVEDSDFSREPFFATFQSGNFRFTLVDIHVTWGKSISARKAEAGRLTEVVQYVKSFDGIGDNIIVTGDFNIDGPSAEAFNELRNAGFSPLFSKGKKEKGKKDTPKGTSETGNRYMYSTYSTSPHRIGSRLYDNMWVSSTTMSRVDGTMGILKPHRFFFADRQHPHLVVRKKISDHCPVWADFKVM